MKRYRRPVIIITCSSDRDSPGRRENYEECVVQAGGAVVFVHPDGDAVKLAAKYDGVIVPGGRDVDPFLYGESQLPGTVLEERGRTEFEFSLLGEIMKERKPVLGICYGMQLINVFFKGSLFQDIRSMPPGPIDHRKGSHIIEIRDNPYLKPGECEVNSSHHQAIRRAGAGMKPWAYAVDGVIEGVYCEGYDFLVGVQWHPERMESLLTTNLFRRFIDVCRKR